jgi:hypothetical protein
MLTNSTSVYSTCRCAHLTHVQICERRNENYKTAAIIKLQNTAALTAVTELHTAVLTLAVPSEATTTGAIATGGTAADDLGACELSTVRNLLSELGLCCNADADDNDLTEPDLITDEPLMGVTDTAAVDDATVGAGKGSGATDSDTTLLLESLDVLQQKLQLALTLTTTDFKAEASAAASAGTTAAIGSVVPMQEE